MTVGRRPLRVLARARRRAAAPLLPRTAALLPRPAALLAASALVPLLALGLLAQGRVMLHDCFGAAGALGPLGLRLAVLRDAAQCPDGTYGLGPVPAGAVVLFSVALPVLLLHAVLAAGGVGLWALVLRAVRGAGAVLGRVLGVVGLRLRPVLLGPVRPTVSVVPVTVPAGWLRAAGTSRRGPPVPA